MTVRAGVAGEGAEALAAKAWKENKIAAATAHVRNRIGFILPSRERSVYTAQASSKPPPPPIEDQEKRAKGLLIAAPPGMAVAFAGRPVPGVADRLAVRRRRG